MRNFKTLLFLLLFLTPALAQQTVITKPYVATLANFSSSITTTNTFQTVLVLNASRTGCTLQNKGSHDMYVYFGPATSATIAASAILSSQQSLTCIIGSVVIKEELAITGTQGDLFYASSQ